MNRWLSPLHPQVFFGYRQSRDATSVPCTVQRRRRRLGQPQQAFWGFLWISDPWWVSHPKNMKGNYPLVIFHGKWPIYRWFTY